MMPERTVALCLKAQLTTAKTAGMPPSLSQGFKGSSVDIFSFYHQWLKCSLVTHTACHFVSIICSTATALFCFSTM